MEVKHGRGGRDGTGDMDVAACELSEAACQHLVRKITAPPMQTHTHARTSELFCFIGHRKQAEEAAQIDGRQQHVLLEH